MDKARLVCKILYAVGVDKEYVCWFVKIELREEEMKGVFDEAGFR